MKKRYQSPVIHTTAFGPEELTSTSSDQVTQIGGDADLHLGEGSDGTDQRSRYNSVWDE